MFRTLSFESFTDNLHDRVKFDYSDVSFRACIDKEGVLELIFVMDIIWMNSKRIKRDGCDPDLERLMKRGYQRDFYAYCVRETTILLIMRFGALLIGLSSLNNDLVGLSNA